MDKRTIKIIHELKLLSIVAIAFVAFHMILNRSVESWYLPWNLFLAWVPLLVAMYLVSTPLHRYIERLLLAVWLVFLPNAFYVMTDIIHINDQIRFSQTYDVLTIMMTIIPSFLVGLVSLYLMDKKYLSPLSRIKRRASIATVAVLSGIAIYIGRELRWNSWDIIANPYAVTTDFVRVITTPESLAQLALTVIGYTVVTLISYRMYRRLAD